MPGLKIVMPSTPYGAKGLLRSALYDPDPVLYFEHKKCYRMITGEVPDEDYDIPIGKAEIKRKGDALTVIAYGLMLHHCLAAADRLSQEEGLEAEVLDPRSVAPMDWPAIFGSVTKTSKAMIVYEDNRTLGVGAEISARIGEELFYDLDAPVVRIGGPDVPATPYSKVLEEFFLPTPDQIYAQMREASGVSASASSSASSSSGPASSWSFSRDRQSTSARICRSMTLAAKRIGTFIRPLPWRSRLNRTIVAPATGSSRSKAPVGRAGPAITSKASRFGGW